MSPLRSAALALLLSSGALLAAPAAHAGDTYKVDDDHSAVIFAVQHLGVSTTYGRFNEIKGELVLDDDPAKSSVTVTVQAASVDTDQDKRDKHLRGADFFAADEFPEITFVSKKMVKKSDTVWAVTGDLTLHGVTQEITVEFTKIGEGSDPWGGYRLGLEGSFTIKRSDFGMTHMPDGIGDEVRLTVALEGIKKKIGG